MNIEHLQKTGGFTVSFEVNTSMRFKKNASEILLNAAHTIMASKNLTVLK